MFIAKTTARVRPIAPPDAPALATLFRAAWFEAYSGLLPHDYIKRLTDKRNAAWWLDRIPARPDQKLGNEPLILDINDTVAGYALCGPLRMSRRRSGEIYELYLAPDYQGQGHGELLFEACRYLLDQKSLPGLTVWMLATNTRAQDFYWRRGGRPSIYRDDVLGGVRVPLVGYAFP